MKKQGNKKVKITKDLKFKNLYEALTSQISYCNKIEEYGQNDVSFKNTNFNLLKVIFGGFYLTSVIDDYITVQKDKTVNSKFVPEFMKHLVPLFAKDNGKGYTMGQLSYKDEYEVLLKLRNKLAHGDFIVENGEIVFEENGLEGRVKINDFMRFIATFDVNKDDYLASGPRKKVLFFNYTDNRTIYNESDFDYACNNIYKLEITDSPVFPKKRTVRYCELIKDFYAKLTEIQKSKKNTSPEQVEMLFRIFEYTLKQEGIHINYSMKKVSEMAEYQEIKSKYMINKKSYKKLNKESQVLTITNIANRVMKGEYQKFDLQKGIFLNGTIILNLEENPNRTLTDIVTARPAMCMPFLHHIDSSIVTSYLVAFNAAYEYGLEKGLTTQGAYNWVSIYDGTSLDFSKLNLEKFDCDNMVIEHTFTKYNTDILDYETTELKSIDNLIGSYEKSLNDYLNYAQQEDKEKEAYLRKRLIDAKEEKLKLLDKIRNLKLNYQTFDLNKYTRNINIIIHIRNAIAHGNVFVESCCDGKDINDVKIIFRDYLDGNVSYEKQITIRDFVSIFGKDNMNCVYSFIVNNMDDKSLISQEFQEELNKRLVKRYNQ